VTNGTLLSICRTLPWLVLSTTLPTQEDSWQLVTCLTKFITFHRVLVGHFFNVFSGGFAMLHYCHSSWLTLSCITVVLSKHHHADQISSPLYHIHTNLFSTSIWSNRNQSAHCLPDVKSRIRIFHTKYSSVVNISFQKLPTPLQI